MPTTIYLILPASKLGNAIERHVRNELPDVNIEDWDYRVDGDAPASRGSSVNAVSQAVLTFMKNSPPGRYLIKDVCAKLKLTMKQQNALKEALKKKRKIVDDLTLINAGYKVEGKGRAAKSYLCKEASDYGGKPLKVC